MKIFCKKTVVTPEKRTLLRRTHAGDISTAKGLQRLHAALSDGREYTPMELIQKAKVTNLTASIKRLRLNGCQVMCRYIGKTKDGARLSKYQMLEF
jgi:hypothetical protein